jgi:hypothetical protein
MHKCDEDFAGLEILGVSKICEYMGLTSFLEARLVTRIIPKSQRIVVTELSWERQRPRWHRARI